MISVSDIYSNVVTLILYVLVFGFFFSRKHLWNLTEKLLISILIFASMVPLLELVGRAVIELKLRYWIVITVNDLCYTVQLLSSVLFALFIIAQIEMQSSVSTRRKVFILAPVVVAILIVATNPFTGWLFSYNNDDHIFKPARGLLYIQLVAVGYFIWAAIYVYINRDYFAKSTRKICYIIGLFNLVGAGVQALIPELQVRDYFEAISLLMICLEIQGANDIFDPETGLAGNGYFEELCTRKIYSKEAFKIVFIKLTETDLLSVSYGQKVMLGLEKALGTMLSKSVATGNAFRISNDYFALTLPYIYDSDSLMMSIVDSINKSWVIDNVDIHCTANVACISYPDHYADVKTLHAYITFFRKYVNSHGGIISEEEIKISDEIREEQVVAAIDRGLKNNYFEIYYQPICRSGNREYMTAEALIRLKDPTLGFISPGEFIPIAERNGKILDIGLFVLDRVCAFIASNDIRQMGLDYVELNLSVVQVLQRDFVSKTLEIIDKYKINPDTICAEITETATNLSPNVFIENIAKLKEIGVKLALDDYGTGYSNIQRLASTSFEIIKFDRDMIQQVCDDPYTREIFEKLVVMFHSLGAEIVAEGIETHEQYDCIRNAGADYLQGYYFSKPVPEAEFVKFLENNSR